MRIALLVLTLAATTACAGTRQPAPEWLPAAVAAPPTPEPLGVYMRSRVGPFVLVNVHRYPDEANGVGLRYRGPDSTLIDLYVYPGPDLGAQCDEGCSRTLLKNEIEGFQAIFPQMIQQRYVDSIRVEKSRPLSRPANAPWRMGHALELRVVRNGVPQRSDFVLFYAPSVRFKVRATYPATDSVKRYVAEFTQNAVATLAVKPVELPEPTRENILRSIEGEWDWSTSNLVCGPDRHTIKVAPDGQTFTLTFGGDEPSVTLYHITNVGPGIVTDAPHTVRARIDDETRTTSAGRLVVWDLVLSASDAYAWHRSDWDEDGRTPIIVRCD